MEISTKLLEVHPEDRDLVGRLAVLQDMHDQVCLQLMSIPT